MQQSRNLSDYYMPCLQQPENFFNLAYYNISLVISGSCKNIPEKVFSWILELPFDFKDQSGNNLMHLAVILKNAHAVKYLQKINPFLVNQYNIFGLQPIDYAFGHDDLFTLLYIKIMEIKTDEKLIKNILLSNINETTVNEWTSLHLALDFRKRGYKLDYPITKIVKNQITLNKYDVFDKRPIDYAIEFRDLEMIILLLGAGADINRVNLNGVNSFMRSLLTNEIVILHFFLLKNPDLSLLYINLEFSSENSALDNKNIIQFMVEQKTYNKIIKELYKFNPTIFANHKSLKHEDDNLNSLLHLAANYSNHEILEFLLDKKIIDVNTTNKNLETALTFAVNKFDSEAVKILLRHNADTEVTNLDGQTLLEFVCFMLSDLNKSDDYSKKSSFHSLYYRVIILLLEYGAVIDHIKLSEDLISDNEINKVIFEADFVDSNIADLEILLKNHDLNNMQSNRALYYLHGCTYEPI